MAYAGQTIYNPITGENIRFLKTTEQTNGELLVFDCRVEPGKATLPPHVHATQEERFEIISGQLGVMLGGKKQILNPGDRVTLPAKVKHQWWVPGDEEVHFRVEVSPARNLEAVLEIVSEMAITGKLNKQVMPKNPFVLAAFGKFSETYLPVIPIWMQNIGLNMGTAFARTLGYDPEFNEYRTRATATAELEAAA